MAKPWAQTSNEWYLFPASFSLRFFDYAGFIEMSRNTMTETAKQIGVDRRGVLFDKGWTLCSPGHSLSGSRAQCLPW
jgi:hypothetical protein